jgi:HK97 family phage prohead protease
MPTEKRSTMSPVELRADGDGPPRIVGYAAKYYRADDPTTEYRLFGNAVERIAPGAFDDAIKGDDIRGLFNHNADHLLGRTKSGTLKVSSDDVGLRYEIQPADTNVYRDVVEHLKRGDVDGSSFQFSTVSDEWRMDGDMEVRTLKKVKLYDVGPVVFPAYEAATSGVRSEDVAECRSSRDQWRGQVKHDVQARNHQIREIELRVFDTES